jgi:acetylornithine deacetylase/succinyl-diaminopimelate desuccinylase-like protein
MTSTPDWHTRPAELLQQLIRFDTSNPPGNEAGLIGWMADVVRSYGIEPVIVGKSLERTNLIARLKGRGDAPPLLLYGHVDVVPAHDQQWTHPPFGGDLIDGYAWGRGALDMKGGDAMLSAAFLRAAAEGVELPFDLILALTADEEDGSEFGARYLVSQHAELFEGVRYGLSEFGGFPLPIAGRRFYPIMVAERYIYPLRVTVRGQGGHGAQRATGTAMSRLGRVLTALDGARLPVHITPVTAALINAVASELPEPTAAHIRALLDPAQTDAMLDQLGAPARMFDPLLHNTINPTLLHGGTRINVVPSEITLTMDGRVLPGVTPDEFLAEVRALIGDDLDIAPVSAEDPTALPNPDMTHFAHLADILRQLDPTGVPVPYMVSGGTDARVFAQLGIQTYGFIPMALPEGFNFASLIHAADERIPAEAVRFGAEAIYRAVTGWQA